jgi:hypothetical protein
MAFCEPALPRVNRLGHALFTFHIPAYYLSRYSVVKLGEHIAVCFRKVSYLLLRLRGKYVQVMGNHPPNEMTYHAYCFSW